ncbi:MAG: GNAT family N-acetyltransferase [Rhodospirillaceae bacterium]|nr:GNAT family N-acetyltransferase [Rhodospirillaceae bacterium]
MRCVVSLNRPLFLRLSPEPRWSEGRHGAVPENKTRKTSNNALDCKESPDQPEVARLLCLADARAAALYPTENRHGASVADLISQGVRFFVARSDAAVIGCGGYAMQGENASELKRMFVETAARGGGVGRALLRTIEEAARAEGVRVMRLETGIQSVEARWLNGSLGYRARGPFGAYGPDPLSVFMDKDLLAE